MPEPARTIRIAIADDHPIFRDGLRRLLESEPGFEVVGESADGVEAARMVAETRPDVLLLDVAMPRRDGLETLEVLGQDGGETKVILLTASIDSPDVLRAVRLGARGVVLKEAATRQLVEGIHRVMDGKYLIDSTIADDLAGAVRRAEPPKSAQYGLTVRERDIVAAIVAGESNRDIAARLNISQQTVKHHLTSIFDKTGVSTRLELALLAIKQRLADGPRH